MVMHGLVGVVICGLVGVVIYRLKWEWLCMDW